MDWNGNIRVPFVSPPENSFSFLYNYNYDQFPEITKQPWMQTTMLPTFTDKNNNSMNIVNHGHDPKKKRLSNEQLELLENSFHDEIKLDPDRKMKLAKELGLQPRQIAVWFQNRKARWKSKQLERLYDALKQEYDAVSRDKHKLQQEVFALRAVLKEQVVGKKQISTGYTEISREETIESTSIPSSSDQNPRHDPTANNNLHQIADHCNNNYYPLNLEYDYNNNNNNNNNNTTTTNNNTAIMMPSYWAATAAALPSCP